MTRRLLPRATTSILLIAAFILCNSLAAHAQGMPLPEVPSPTMTPDPANKFSVMPDNRSHVSERAQGDDERRAFFRPARLIAEASPSPTLNDAPVDVGAADKLSSTPAQSSTPAHGGTPPVVLTARQKLNYGARQAFFSPGAYIGPALGAGFRYLQEERAPNKTGKDKFADYLSNYARNFATSSTTELFASGIYPALFRQQPKYTTLEDRSGGRASRRSRLLYALSSAIITTGDNGKRQPNYSRLAGNFTGAALGNIWERDIPTRRDSTGRVTEFSRQRGVGPTFTNFAAAVGFDAISFVLDEFIGCGR